VFNAVVETTMVEFMIAHNVNYMGELKTTTLEEIAEASNSLLLTTQISKRTMLVWIKVEVGMFVKVCGDHNVTAKNQYITTVIICDIDIAEF
jgi:hypothetical protein